MKIATGIAWRQFRRGFTLVELLAVIAIIGILIALLLPAIESAREAARRTACANNLHQIALAIRTHEEAQKTFPTGGWGADWVGDPDAGFSTKQPGGWIYNILPYIEESSLRNIGKGMPAAQKRAALVELVRSPIPVFQCISRRLPGAYPFKGTKPLQNVNPVTEAAKSDYAISEEIAYVKSETLSAEIHRKRGLGKTVLVGEKAIAQDNYRDGTAPGDMLTMYVGDCDDVRRTASGNPTTDLEGGAGFGGPHGGCNVAMCDGAVRFVLTSDKLQP
jgi:prepilin-type N-terminal cleavage/methylation domain-containing protein/prepilin-type processing-associated H-X9-DG protein